MKYFVHLLLFFAVFSVHAQIRFEPGYIVDNNGVKKDVLIQNKDWRSNPSTIRYKLTEDGSTQTASITDIKEFGIGNETRYLKFYAPIDKSPIRLELLRTNPEPEYQMEWVFLNKMVEGKADLYLYRGMGVDKFFYSFENGEVQPLVHKKFIEGTSVKHNNQFRNQLYSELNCGDKSAEEFRGLTYSAEVLRNYFIDYNKCKNVNYTVFEKNLNKLKINLHAKAGLDFSRIHVIKGYNAGGMKFDPKNSLRLGAEMELVLPFKRDKWAVFIESTYRTQKLEGEYINKTTFESYATELDFRYDYFTGSGGLRHYFFFDEKSRLYLNTAMSFDIPLRSEIKFDRVESYPMDPVLNEVEVSAYLVFGMGFSYLNKVSAEFRYELDREMTGRNFVPTHYDLDWSSETTSFSILFAYRIF